MRFLDAIEHYGMRIIYRSGKLNVMADYLSRPPEDISETTFPVLGEEEGEGDDLSQNDTIKDPWQLNRLDLQAIAEHLSHGEALPARITEDWVRIHFIWHQDALHRILTYQRVPGDQP